MTVGGAIGWYAGSLVGIMTAFILSCVGTGVGLYLARRLAQPYLVVLIGLCLAASSSVRAQAAAQTPTPGTTKAAAELMQVIHADKQLQDQIGAAFDVQIQNNPAMAPYRNALLTFMQKYLTWQTMGPELTATYAQLFTESELKDLIAFYKTPTGQKYASLQPALAAKSQTISLAILQQHQSELADLMRQQAGTSPTDTTKH